MNYAYSVHMAVLNVDSEIGAVAVERYLVAFDVGRAVNPRPIKGQIVRGFAQGLGGALMEEFLYDAHGELLSVTFADFLMPTASDVPTIDVLITEDAPSPCNPLGIKGAGEASITGVGAAIASAIDDAISEPGAVMQLPVTRKRLKKFFAADSQERLASVTLLNGPDERRLSQKVDSVPIAT